MNTTYTFGRRLAGTPEDLRPMVESALKAEGFGVITEIDVAAVLKAKLGLDRSPYLILGACNPELAYRALDIDSSIGTLLPCNVVLRSEGDGTVIEAIDPVVALQIAASPQLLTVAIETRARLARAMSALGTRGVLVPA
jgi:uncharacterized protein (DUF302 family)